MTDSAAAQLSPRVASFACLFDGRRDVYGLDKGRIVRDPVTLQHYLRHVRGDEGEAIGIFPLLDDGTCRFAAIDLDEPDFELACDLQMFLPGATWIERSRSGNAHVWAFFRAPTPAWIPRGIMLNALESLGRRNVEVFPKQDRLKPGMVGNYINLPYHGDERAILDYTRLDNLGANLPLNTFLDEALYNLNDPADWHGRALALEIRPPEERAPASEFGERTDVHACAKYIYQRRETNPIREGHRAVVIFNLSKMLLNWKALSLEDAWEMVREVNACGDPPAPEREARRIFDTAVQGQYTSTGCDDPLMADYVEPDCPIANA